MSKAVIAASRFGFGARPGDLIAIEPNPEKWLKDQLQGPSRLPDEIKRLPESSAVLVTIEELRRERREHKQDDPDTDIVKVYGRTVRDHYIDQTSARYRAAAESDVPFHERLVHFWSNHFAISADKQLMPAIAGLYEKEAVRPNVTGKFVDLLFAVEKHPAMILYLDNQRSVGPGSTLGVRAKRRKTAQQVGLNENLAREILELHTLGVDGDYTQQDVTAFAKVITGWSLGGANERGQFAEGVPGTFEFREAIHEPGDATLLGKRYSQKGVRQGEAVLNDLATHPSTARFLSTKLARHFVADDPPESMVDRMAEAYLRSGGELTALYEVLIESEEVWVTTFSKYKTPNDFVISTLRAFNHTPDNPRFIAGALDLMGQAPYRPGSPAGWPDTAQQWGGADALYKRIEWSNTVARVVGSRVNPVDLGDSVLGDAFRPESRKAISRAESFTQGMTLFLASPDFQRR
ncbi:MAG: DUF1800 domain-containing protein [Woeseiaceae bacterium]|nr:DUF1800 domain-containing protein [Woeseiaceae bacterium]